MMPTTKDDRIPLRFATAAQAGPGEALLIEDLLLEARVTDAAPLPAQPFMLFAAAGTAAKLVHVRGCACCMGRGAAAMALAELFQARALGKVAWFTGVVAVVTDPATVTTELQSDRLAAARFRVLP